MYEPPAELGPGELGTLIDNSTDMRDVTATLVDLAVHRFVAIEERKQDRLFGLIVRQGVRHSASGSRAAAGRRSSGTSNGCSSRCSGRPPWATRTAAGAGDDVARVGDAVPARKPLLQGSARNFATGLYQQLVERGYYVPAPRLGDDRLRRRWRCWAASLIGVGGALINVSLGAQPFAAIIAGGLVALIIIGFGVFMPARTESGTRALEGVLGFEEFLSRVEADRFDRVVKTPEMFETFLPFAMALGVEKNWARAFEGICKEPPDVVPRRHSGGVLPAGVCRIAQPDVDARGGVHGVSAAQLGRVGLRRRWLERRRLRRRRWWGFLMGRARPVRWCAACAVGAAVLCTSGANLRRPTLQAQPAALESLNDLFATTRGMVRDTNGDGLADTVAASVIIPPAPTADDVEAAINIGARLGFETTALTLPVVVREDELDRPEGIALPILVGRDNSLVKALVARGSLELKTLSPGQGLITLVRSPLGGADGVAVVGGDDAGTLAAGIELAARLPRLWNMSGITLSGVERQILQFLTGRGIGARTARTVSVVVDAEKRGIATVTVRVETPADQVSRALSALVGLDVAHQRGQEPQAINFAEVAATAIEVMTGTRTAGLAVVRRAGLNSRTLTPPIDPDELLPEPTAERGGAPAPPPRRRRSPSISAASTRSTGGSATATPI